MPHDDTSTLASTTSADGDDAATVSRLRRGRALFCLAAAASAQEADQLSPLAPSSPASPTSSPLPVRNFALALDALRDAIAQAKPSFLDRPIKRSELDAQLSSTLEMASIAQDLGGPLRPPGAVFQASLLGPSQRAPSLAWPG